MISRDARKAHRTAQARYYAKTASGERPIPNFNPNTDAQALADIRQVTIIRITGTEKRIQAPTKHDKGFCYSPSTSRLDKRQRHKTIPINTPPNRKRPVRRY